MRRPRAGYLNKLSIHPKISDYSYCIDSMDPSGQRSIYYLDHLNKFNYEYSSQSKLNRKDYRLNQEDFYKI